MRTGTCPYCGWTFAITKRHEGERVLPYCSHGCRLAVEAPTSRGGQSIVSWDGDSDDRARVQPAPDVCLCQTVRDRVVAGFQQAMQGFFSLDRSTRDLVVERFVNPDTQIAETARKFGVSQQAAHARLKRARELWPALATCIPMRLLENGRKAHRKEGVLA